MVNPTRRPAKVTVDEDVRKERIEMDNDDTKR